MKITIIEANMTGLQHAYPNGIYARIFSELAEKTDLYCSEEHYKNLAIDDLRMAWHPVTVLSAGKQRIKKFFLEYRQSRRIIQESDADIIVFLSCFPNVQFFLTLLSRKFSDKKIIIMTHGEAEGLVLPGKWKFWSYPFWITLCFKLQLPENMYRIVLGKSIAENLGSFSDGKRIFFIDQPRDGFKESNSVRPQIKNNTFAFIGNCLYKKGGESIIKASEGLDGDSDSCFEIIGAYDLKESEITPRIKLFGKPHEMIPRAEFNRALENITYACFPYPSDTYRFTASGAVLDAIIYLKPIIYVKNDYFDGIFKDAGDIGYRCENEDEFIRTIALLDAAPNAERYVRQVENLKKLQKKFSIETVKQQISLIIKNIEENTL